MAAEHHEKKTLPSAWIKIGFLMGSLACILGLAWIEATNTAWAEAEARDLDQAEAWDLVYAWAEAEAETKALIEGEAAAKTLDWAVAYVEAWDLAKIRDRALASVGALVVVLASAIFLARARVKTLESSILAWNHANSGASIPQLEQYWTRFGIIVPPYAREKYFRPSLNEQLFDCHEELGNTPTRSGRFRVIAWRTTLAFLTALDSLRLSILRRLANELNWIAGKLSKS